jgi:hypothetical protein
VYGSLNSNESLLINPSIAKALPTMTSTCSEKFILMTPRSVIELNRSSQHISILYRIACSRECYSFTFIDVKEQRISLEPLRQFIQIRLNFHTVLKTPDAKKQVHIIGVEQHTDIVENHIYSVENQIKHNGPRRFPCETPDVTLISFETVSPILKF